MYEPQEMHFRAARDTKNFNDSIHLKSTNKKLSFPGDEDIEFQLEIALGRTPH